MAATAAGSTATAQARAGARRQTAVVRAASKGPVIQVCATEEEKSRADRHADEKDSFHMVLWLKGFLTATDPAVSLASANQEFIREASRDVVDRRQIHAMINDPPWIQLPIRALNA
jgi:hypothetical protein